MSEEGRGGLYTTVTVEEKWERPIFGKRVPGQRAVRSHVVNYHSRKAELRKTCNIPSLPKLWLCGEFYISKVISSVAIGSDETDPFSWVFKR